MCVSDVSHLFLGVEAETHEGCQEEAVFFFSSNFGDVKIAAGESHRSMKRIIMHEPLTQ